MDKPTSDPAQVDEKEHAGPNGAAAQAKGKGTTSAAAEPAKHSLLDKIHALFPEWLGSHLKNRRTWKNWVRSMVALFAALVLMMVNSTDRWLGSAAFFGLIAMSMLPPAYPIVIYTFMVLTMGVGMLLGWAWGCASMAAGLRARDTALYQQQAASLEKSLDPTLPIQLQIQEAAFAGHFLDPRQSAVYGAFFFIGCYVFGIIRARKPMLILLSIYSSIILDLMATMGPMVPEQQYTLAKSLLLPAAITLSIGSITILVLFPQSLNHLVLGMVVDKVMPALLAMIQAQEEVLSSDPNDTEEWASLATRVHKYRSGFIALSQALSASGKMLPLEISRGRIGAKQLARLCTKTRDLGTQAFGLGSFAVMVHDNQKSLATWDVSPLPHSTMSENKRHEIEGRLRAGNGRRLEDLLPQVREQTADLRNACLKGMSDAIAWLKEVNDHRWKKVPAGAPPITVRQENIENLKAALKTFREDKHLKFLAPFQDMFDPVTGRVKDEEISSLPSSLRGLFHCCVFTASLIAFGEALVEYLEYILKIEIATPKAKFQFPRSAEFTNDLVRNVNDNSGTDGNFNIGMEERTTGDNDNENDEQSRRERVSEDDTDDDTLVTVEEVPEKKTARAKAHKKLYRRDPDAGPPTNAFQKACRGLAHVWNLSWSPDGLFALKYATVSLLFWIVAVHPSSAKFFYDNRGLWALIMAQTGLGASSGEQLANFLSRMTGTIIGVVVGMVIWYIGAGKGDGNPYGIAAATLVFGGIFMFIRISAPPHLMGFWIMTLVTITFVVGYSWVDTHVPQIGNQGAGSSLAGRRALLVLVGFVAAMGISLFPHPVSARKLVRKGLSKNTLDLSDLFGTEVIAFEQARNDVRLDTPKRHERYRKEILRVYSRLHTIRTRASFANLEPNLRGPWAKDVYQQLIHAQARMLSAEVIVAGSYARLQPEWCRQLTEGSDLFHPAFVADVMSLFTLLRHSLRDGSPLPPIVPIFERLAYHRAGTIARRAASTNASYLDLQADDQSLQIPGQTIHKLAHVASRAEMTTRTELALVNTVGGVLTRDALHNEQFAVLASALIAFVQVISALNDMHHGVLELVGERELEDFDLAAQRWAKADAMV